MSIEIKPENFYIGFWNFEFPTIEGLTERGNFLACCYRPLKEPSAPWAFCYRFRYYKDDKFFDSDDIKHWYERSGMAGMKPEAVKATTTDLVTSMLGLISPEPKVNFYELMCDGDQAMDKMLASPPPFMQVEQQRSV